MILNCEIALNENECFKCDPAYSLVEGKCLFGDIPNCA